MHKKKYNKDPFAKREAEKYGTPIPSREYIIQHLLERNSPAKLAEIIKELKVATSDEQPLKWRLKAMLRDGQLEQLKNRRYWPYGKRLLIEGTLTFDRNKNLWCLPDTGGNKIAIKNYYNELVTHGSKVIVSIPDLTINKDEIIEGKIIQVLATAGQSKVVGRFVSEQQTHYVISHDKTAPHDIIIPSKNIHGAVDGDIVVVEILQAFSRNADPIGKVIEVIGNENNKGIEIAAAIQVHNLPEQWPAAVDKQLATIKDNITNNKQRVDVRDLPLVTIDGEDAKDFDDAVFCRANSKGGWTLYVAIADVSHYVKPNTALDKESLLRGNSVYFPGKVIPMLPEKLSNGLCSLLPAVDRFCMVCEMHITADGKLSRYKFYEAIMRSHARLTYTKVAKILNHESKQLATTYVQVLPNLFCLHELFLALQKQREVRGAIDFDTVSTSIIFNSKGKINKIVAQERNIAHKIIEECMLCANVATAKFLVKHKIPGLYRIHEMPAADKIADLKLFLNGLGLTLTGQYKSNVLDYSQLLKKIKHRADANIIQTILLRSMCQAVYSPDNIGHFGLAFPAYAHFTSPIRRYPDLLVHRQIKTILQGKWQLAITKQELEKQQKIQENFKQIALHCSMTERRADDATRFVDQWLKCQYICQHLGKAFRGIISGVSRFGFFVEIGDIYVDGLVHVSSLTDDYYHYDPVKHLLYGERTGITYTLGMQVEIIVAKVDIDNRRIDLAIVKPKSQKKVLRDIKNNKNTKAKKSKHKR